MVLAASALLVVPVASWTSTALLGSRRAEQRLHDRYASDAGVEHALWRVQYESGFADSLSPSVGYNQSFNGLATSIVVAAVATPIPQHTPTPAPTQSGAHAAVAPVVDPNSTTPGQPESFSYTLYIRNFGTAKVHTEIIGDTLPPGFTYSAGSVSSSGITKGSEPLVLGEPAIAIVAGSQQLTWQFTAPLPEIGAGTTATVEFGATASPAEGSYANEAWIETPPQQLGVVSSGPGSPVLAAWPQFDITSAGGLVTIKARAHKPDGGVVILSWQVE